MKQDLQRLAKQAYHRTDWGSKLVRRYDRARRSITAPLSERVEHLYQWFLTPMTLWPCNLHGFLEKILDALENGRKPDAAMELLLNVLPPLPDPKTIEAVTAHEHDVQAGRYEHLVPASPAKFLTTERTLAKNPEFRADWKKITDGFDISLHADHKGVIRRTMVPERNLRTNFGLVSDDDRQAHRLARIRSRATFQCVPASGNASRASNRRSNSSMWAGVKPIADESSAIESQRSSTI